MAIKYEANNPAHDAAIGYAFKRFRRWCEDHSYDEIMALEYVEGFLDGYSHAKAMVEIHGVLK